MCLFINERGWWQALSSACSVCLGKWQNKHRVKGKLHRLGTSAIICYCCRCDHRRTLERELPLPYVHFPWNATICLSPTHLLMKWNRVCLGFFLGGGKGGGDKRPHFYIALKALYTKWILVFLIRGSMCCVGSSKSTHTISVETGDADGVSKCCSQGEGKKMNTTKTFKTLDRKCTFYHLVRLKMGKLKLQHKALVPFQYFWRVFYVYGNCLERWRCCYLFDQKILQ